MDNIFTVATTTLGLGAGGGAGFFFVRWLFEFLGGRMDKRADRIDAGTDKLISLMQAEMKRLSERVDGLEEDLRDCKRRHAESDAEVMRLKAILQGYGEAREKAQLIVSSEKGKKTCD